MSVPVCGVRSPLTYTKSRTLIWENGRRLKSITDESGSLLSMEYGGIMYYYGKNLQGDILRLVDGNGKTAAEYEYDSWGSLTAVKGENGEDIRNEAGHIGNINPFRYRGYYYDSETGFYYLGSRYYDPEVGRFISADTTDILGVSGNLYDKNLYAYCDNNPVMRKDLDGQCWITVGIMAVGGVIGATVSAVGSATIQKSLTGTVNWKSVAVAAASGFVSGAVAASPLGKVWQIRLGAGLGAASYIADCKVNKQEIAVDELAVSALVGGVSGAIGGPGANQDMVLTKTIQTSIKTANRMVARKCTAYAAKRIAVTTAWRNNILIVSALGGSARFAAGIGISNGLTSGWTRIRSRVLNWFKR